MLLKSDGMDAVDKVLKQHHYCLQMQRLIPENTFKAFRNMAQKEWEHQSPLITE